MTAANAMTNGVHIPQHRIKAGSNLRALQNGSSPISSSSPNDDAWSRTCSGNKAFTLWRTNLFSDAPSVSVVFPLYDGHGNMIATVARDSSPPHYSIANSRTYDAWRGIRTGASTKNLRPLVGKISVKIASIRTGVSTGNPQQRYCASLGHRADDESEGLIYMRARYYEPWTGRYLSEDSRRQGWNWFAYCNSNPRNYVDPTGTSAVSDFLNVLYVLDVISGIGMYMCLHQLGDSLAEGIPLTEMPSLGWAGGAAFFAALAVVGILLTIEDLVGRINQLAYLAASQGHGDEVLSIVNTMKQCRLLAPLAHCIEICAWLGMIDCDE